MAAYCWRWQTVTTIEYGSKTTEGWSRNCADGKHRTSVQPLYRTRFVENHHSIRLRTLAATGWRHRKCPTSVWQRICEIDWWTPCPDVLQMKRSRNRVCSHGPYGCLRHARNRTMRGLFPGTASRYRIILPLKAVPKTVGKVPDRAARVWTPMLRYRSIRAGAAGESPSPNLRKLGIEGFARQNAAVK